MRVLARVCTIALLIALAQTAGAGEAAWTQVLEKDGVVVSERPDGEGRPVRSKATTHIDATIFEILAYLQDDAIRTRWLDRCTEARSLEERSRWDRLSYTRFALWPFSDRDVVVENLITVGPDAASAEVRMRSVDTDFQPPVPGVVRMPWMRGEFHLEQMDEGTQIDFSLALELGGRVPARLELYARQKIPLESLRNLRKQVPSSRGNYAPLVRSWRRELSVMP